MTNILFETWEACCETRHESTLAVVLAAGEQMRDPEFRAAVEALEPEYQEYLRTVRGERRRMNQDEQEARIIALEQQVAAIAGMVNNAARETEERIEKLEAALRDTVHCLIGGSVDVSTALPSSDTFHEHHILGVGSAMTMAEIYRRLKE